MGLRHEPCLVLRRIPWGESSLIVHALTPRIGRVHFLVKGAYRPKSSLCGLFDAFDTLELEWRHSRGRELQTVHKGDIEERRRYIAADATTYRAAWTVLELAGLAALPDAPDEKLFARVSRALDGLNTLAEAGRSSTDVNATLVLFELGFLDDIGLAPALERCAACRSAAPAVDPGGRRVAFSAGAGGRLCASCAHEARSAGRRVGTLPLEVLESCARISTVAREAEADCAERQKITECLDSDAALHARDFLERFLAFHLQTSPRSNRAFLAAPNRNARA